MTLRSARTPSLPDTGKILVVSQRYPPDPSTTATYIGAIAEALATDHRVTVLTAQAGSASSARSDVSRVQVVEIRNWLPRKDALVRRTIAVSLLAIRMFFGTLTRARRNDAVFCVTTPFTLPYAVIFAAKLRRAAAVLLIYDLYPEALEAAGLVKPSSLTARIMRLANRLLFRSLDAIITIGRDVEPLLSRYSTATENKVHFIPNWTLLPVRHRESASSGKLRRGHASELIVGLSGNLGFTHCPRTVYEAARILTGREDVRFLLSGWGVGWRQLCDLQRANELANVSLVEPVADVELAEFLSAADVWIIPYRAGIAGVSIPSRLYNLLAVGRAIIVAADGNSEAALVVRENGIGWVVPPEDPSQLADAIREAAADRAGTIEKGGRAASVAEKYSAAIALVRYRQVILSAKDRR